MSKEQNKSVQIIDPLDPTARERKSDHIEMAFQSQIDLHNIDPRFYYEPLLSAHPNIESNQKFSFIGHEFSQPFWVSSMTGGTEMAGLINQNLAKACGEFGFGMGLGSCRSLLYSNDTLVDFDVRRFMENQPLYANLGIAQVEQLIDENQLYLIDELIAKLSADGLIIHINPLQEWLQPEGDTIKYPPIETIKRVLDKVDCNIIIKEVGQGMGYESLKALFQLPLKAIDFAANGGTNFSKLEMGRADEMVRNNYRKIANLGHSAIEMVQMTNKIIDELGQACLTKDVIISGGVKDFLDGYYLIESINTNAIYGQASAFLRHAMGDYEQLKSYINLQISGLNLAKSFLRVKE